MNIEITTEIINRNELRIVGLSRSGNHAVINWIISQLQGSYCFLNCTEPKHNPFLTARPWNDKEEVFQTNISDFNLQKEQVGEFSEKNHLLYSHEDCFLGSLNKKSFLDNRKQWIGPSELQRDILIVRDPFNLFASRIKSGLILGHYTHHGTRPISTLTLKRIYKQHAGEFLGRRKAMKNKVGINFNVWASKKEYRWQIAEKLNIPFTDVGFTEVPGVAGGSSFDGTRLSGQAHKMNLNDRWKKFASDESFWELFDPEIVELSIEIFGETAPASYYREHFM